MTNGKAQSPITKSQNGFSSFIYNIVIIDDKLRFYDSEIRYNKRGMRYLTNSSHRAISTLSTWNNFSLAIRSQGGKSHQADFCNFSIISGVNL